MKVIVKGRGEVILTQNHFVAMGGQASVYVKDGVAYKVYKDPANAIPYDKFTALSVIKDPNVVKPTDMLVDPKAIPVGYTMNAVKSGGSLPQLYTRAFRQRNGLDDTILVKVAAAIREHVMNVHKADIVIVDLNELNLLLSSTFDDVHLIDVDSYQTPGYPATFIMQSVRDFSVGTKFNQLSDWFSYAVLTFNLFVGVHPYKGTYDPMASIDKDNRLVARMRANISAFRPEVRLPPGANPLSSIPDTFRGWLRAVLEEGRRLHPPDPRGGPVGDIVAPATVVVSGNSLTFDLRHDFDGWDVVSYAETGPFSMALVRKGPDSRVVLNGTNVGQGRMPLLASGTTLVGFTPMLNHGIVVNLDGGRLTYVNMSTNTVEVLHAHADEIYKLDDGFYVRCGGSVMEAGFTEMPGKALLHFSHQVADVLPLASSLHEGCVIQNMLGSTFVTVFPQTLTGYQVRIAELDGYKIIAARFDGGVLMVLGAKRGRYDRLVFRLDGNYHSYDCRKVEDVTPMGVNFVTLSTGVCVCITEAGTLDAFSNRMGSSQSRSVTHDSLTTDMRLTKVGGKVGIIHKDRIYQLSLK